MKDEQLKLVPVEDKSLPEIFITPVRTDVDITAEVDEARFTVNGEAYKIDVDDWNRYCAWAKKIGLDSNPLLD